MLTIDDLPKGIDEFKESFKIVAMAEKLADSDWKYYINRNQYNWTISMKNMPIVIVPLNASHHTPPSTIFFNEQLKTMNHIEKNEFFKKLKEIGMIEVAKPNNRARSWKFLFMDLDSFFNFYVIWNEYRMIEKET